MSDLLSKPYALGPFKLGMNNRLPETDLKMKDGSGAFVRSAVNVDIDGVGQFSRRNGSTLAIAGVDCHSLWSDISDTLAFYVDGTTLYQIVNGIPVAIATGLTPHANMSFDFANGNVYWANGVQTGRVNALVNHSWGLPLPVTQFSVAPVANAGTLQSGTYRFYYVYTTTDGQESGSSDVQTVTLSSSASSPLPTGPNRNADTGTSAIQFTGLPTVAPVSDVVGVTIYWTPPGSEIFYRMAAVGFAGSYLLAAAAALDMQGRTLGLAPMPAGSIVRFYNSRLISVSGNVLFYSKAYALGLHNPADHFIQFPSPITLCMPVQNGVYVTADQTYWLKGELAETELIPALPYGGVAGSDVVALEENAVYWMSSRGMMKGDDDGNIKALTEANNAMSPAAFGASIHREQGGVRQLLTSTFGVQATEVAAATYMTAEVVRKETIL